MNTQEQLEDLAERISILEQKAEKESAAEEVGRLKLQMEQLESQSDLRFEWWQQEVKKREKLEGKLAAVYVGLIEIDSNTKITKEDSADELARRISEIESICAKVTAVLNEK